MVDDAPALIEADRQCRMLRAWPPMTGQGNSIRSQALMVHYSSSGHSS